MLRLAGEKQEQLDVIEKGNTRGHCGDETSSYIKCERDQMKIHVIKLHETNYHKEIQIERRKCGQYFVKEEGCHSRRKE